ncbi:hypothetical protein NDA11_004177 [Ustilago hordei]|nr:hypothetical protein NDA10_000586 [Ustilago hordei]KAJ1574668.1 hypothetical protein NDA12_000891 [Ustilago hordei]KAJ1576669.1 hypothetical protein NDA11_004177 [Ustilago hordei]
MNRSQTSPPLIPAGIYGLPGQTKPSGWMILTNSLPYPSLQNGSTRYLGGNPFPTAVEARTQTAIEVLNGFAHSGTSSFRSSLSTVAYWLFS